MQYIKWLFPGLKVKRWIVLAILGAVLTLFATGLLAESLAYIYSTSLLRWGYAFFGPLAVGPAALVLVVAGLVILIFSLNRAFNSVVTVLAPSDQRSLVDMIYSRRFLKRGPKVVVIGGGTGLSVLLRGLKQYTSNITAIVAVTDDGGSSGRLRDDFGMLPPGDIRNCLVALADTESMMEEILQYRFKAGELSGHNLGNLLLASLNDITGSFHQAIQGVSRVLAIRGQVLPATLQNVVLGAEFNDGQVIMGESKIPDRGGGIRRIFLQPCHCTPLPEALKALEEAEAVILGPGSLFTSILPVLMVGGVAEGLAKTSAVRIYVCNVMTQPGETNGFTASGHLKALHAHAGDVVDYMVVNREKLPHQIRERYNAEGSVPVYPDIKEIEKAGVRPVQGYFAAVDNVVRHNPDKLARTLVRLALTKKSTGERFSIMNNIYWGKRWFNSKKQ